MGWVGSSIAISLLHSGVVKELMLNDVRNGIAEGEAMDLAHGSSFYPPAKIRAAEVPEMHACNVIIITAGRGGRPGESRLELLQENIKVVHDISQQLTGYKGILVVVANPVDVLTWYYQKYTGLPAHRVIGTGTFLDSARLREFVGQELGIVARSVHANVLGEHGNSSVVHWSGAVAGGMKLREWKGWSSEKEATIYQKVTGAAQEIITRKGSTNHAIGLVTAYLVKYLLRNDRRVLCVSSVLDGPYGLHGVALSLPSVVSEDGIIEVLCPKLAEAELQAMKASAEVVQKAIDSVE